MGPKGPNGDCIKGDTGPRGDRGKPGQNTPGDRGLPGNVGDPGIASMGPVYPSYFHGGGFDNIESGIWKSLIIMKLLMKFDINTLL